MEKIRFERKQLEELSEIRKRETENIELECGRLKVELLTIIYRIPRNQYK